MIKPGYFIPGAFILSNIKRRDWFDIVWQAGAANCDDCYAQQQ
jgi:hypothetical protein